ncbi:uncharacterized protein [Panulirus ornatus]|uniref:uncharacterized protein n=1 Tax=Panulirus ornatus TaxID=150431 RepID=UPI003A875744
MLALSWHYAPHLLSIEKAMGVRKVFTPWIIVTLILHITGYAGGVRIRELEVPAVALKDDEVHLKCDYEDEGSSSLYSLKWYKDGREFYRHQPGISSHTPDHKCLTAYAYHVDGVTVDCWVSSEREVVLRGVTTSSSGEYQCEVIGDHPKFRKEVRKARLTVFTEPLQEPQIEGDEESYSPGDFVSLNCSSSNSQYVPALSWLLNGHPVPQRYLIPQVGGRSLGLLVQATLDLFKHGVIAVTCVSSLGSTHTRETQVSLPNRDHLTAQEYYYNAGGAGVASTWVSVTLVTVLPLISAHLY